MTPDDGEATDLAEEVEPSATEDAAPEPADDPLDESQDEGGGSGGPTPESVPVDPRMVPVDVALDENGDGSAMVGLPLERVAEVTGTDGSVTLSDPAKGVTRIAVEGSSAKNQTITLHYRST